MAHFAKLGINSKVIDVLVIDNQDITDKEGIESEQLGIDFLEKLTRYPFWVQTSYNRNIRKNFASVGSTYDDVRDAFIPPQPYPSWVLDEATCLWQAPISEPVLTDEDSLGVMWNEDKTEWRNVYPRLEWDEELINWVLVPEQGE